MRITPFRGTKNKIQGKKSLIELKKDTLSYKIDYIETKLFEKELIKGDDFKQEIERDLVVLSEGTITKPNITYLGKWVENHITEEGDIIYSYNLDISFVGGTVIITCEKKEDWEQAYEKIYNWKFESEIKED